jgi:hypothetical protein
MEAHVLQGYSRQAECFKAIFYRAFQKSLLGKNLKWRFD